jgi:hypothetical protein
MQLLIGDPLNTTSSSASGMPSPSLPAVNVQLAELFHAVLDAPVHLKVACAHVSMGKLIRKTKIATHFCDLYTFIAFTFFS